MIRRSIFEWQSIPYGDAPDEIPTWAADQLHSVAKASQLGGEESGRIVQLGRRALRAGQVVGILAAENCSLEILPKIDAAGGKAEQTTQGQVRKRLIHMLAVALDLDVQSGALSDHDWQSNTLLEILISLFTRDLIDAVRQGMPRRYVGIEDDLPALRGKLDIVRQFSVLAASPQRLACRYDELSSDILLNRIMKAAIDRLRRVAIRPENQRRLAELALTYADISSIPVKEIAWDTVKLDRTNARWRSLLSMARFLLGDRHQTTSMGRQQGFSLLFEMNVLFEQYVGRLLRRALAGSPFSVHLQGGRLYCLQDAETGRRTFQTKPDILIKRGKDVVHIVDTKWKRVTSNVDDPKRGVLQADVYQMMAYGQIYSCDRLTLLYPHHGDVGAAAGMQSSNQIGDGPLQLRTATVAMGAHKAVVEQLAGIVGG